MHSLHAMSATVLIVHIRKAKNHVNAYCALVLVLICRGRCEPRSLNNARKKARVCNKTGNFFHVFIRLLIIRNAHNVLKNYLRKLAIVRLQLS